MFGTLPLRTRLTLILEGLGTGASRVLGTGACASCGAPMLLRATPALDDTSWTLAADNGVRVDDYAILDRLEARRVDLYSAAVAHRGLLGSWPWSHHHAPALDEASRERHSAIVAAHTLTLAA